MVKPPSACFELLRFKSTFTELANQKSKPLLTRMHYQKYFDEIIDKCFESGDVVTSLLVKDKFIDRYGSRNTPHVNKISLMMRLCSKLSNPSQQRKGIQYRKR